MSIKSGVHKGTQGSARAVGSIETLKELSIPVDGIYHHTCLSNLWDLPIASISGDSKFANVNKYLSYVQCSSNIYNSMYKMKVASIHPEYCKQSSMCFWAV